MKILFCLECFEKFHANECDEYESWICFERYTKTDLKTFLNYISDNKSSFVKLENIDKISISNIGQLKSNNDSKN